MSTPSFAAVATAASVGEGEDRKGGDSETDELADGDGEGDRDRVGAAGECSKPDVYGERLKEVEGGEKVEDEPKNGVDEDKDDGSL